MLKAPITHPDLLKALASVGHGSRILIADGYFPAESVKSNRAHIIYLNLRPGMIDSATVLDAVAQMVPIETATMTISEVGRAPSPIRTLFSKILEARCGRPIHIESETQRDFGISARDERVAIVVATGEEQPFANLLLGVGGVTMPGPWVTS